MSKKQYVSVADSVKIVSKTVPASAESIRSLCGADWPANVMLLQCILTPNASITLTDPATADTLTLQANTSKAIPAQNFGELKISGAGTETLVIEIYYQTDSGDS